MRDTGTAGSRVLDICLLALFGAMALYGAVVIISIIWIPLCVGIATIATIALAIGIFRWRTGRW
jgi:hypothetical protein